MSAVNETMAQNWDNIQTAIFYIGLIYLAYLTLAILYLVINGLRVHVFSKFGKGIDFKSRFGEWAVVTGCTEGIGLAHCKELAQRGMNIVMISLLQNDLEAVSKEIEKEFNVRVRIIQADFSGGLDLYHRLAQKLQDVQVGVLVNNVGVAPPFATKFEEMTEKNLWDHLTVNVIAATMMTYVILPGMKQRGKGAIINIASVLGYAPMPYVTVYAATKAYVSSFSRGICMECKGTGVIVQTVAPGFCCTNLVKGIPIVSDEGMHFPTAATFVRSSIRTFGVSEYTSGYICHALTYTPLYSLPSGVFYKLCDMALCILENKKKRTQ